MTEDEAKTKWCPFARARGLGTDATINRPFSGDPEGSIGVKDCCCIASSCMAWQWSDGDNEMTAVHIPKADLMERGPTSHSPGPEWSYVGTHHANSIYSDHNHYWFKRPWAPGQRGGFCGLAGRPE